MATRGKSTTSTKTQNEVVSDLTKLTDAQKKRVRDIKQTGGTVEITKCRFCGKFLVRDASIEQEAGDLCEKLHQEYSTEALMAHRSSMTVNEVPVGFIKVAELHKICVKAGIPVNRMVSAIGRDRGLSAPIDPRFKPLYHKGARYVDPWCASKEGLAMIAGVQTRKTSEEKAKAEIAELEAAELESVLAQ